VYNVQAAPSGKEGGSGPYDNVFPMVDKNMEFNWNGEVSPEKLALARGRLYHP
jgi:hypothetical protein